MAETRLSGKGQITLPVALTRALGMKPGDKLEIVLEGDKMVVRRAGPSDALTPMGFVPGVFARDGKAVLVNTDIDLAEPKRAYMVRAQSARKDLIGALRRADQEHKKEIAAEKEKFSTLREDDEAWIALNDQLRLIDKLWEKAERRAWGAYNDAREVIEEEYQKGRENS